MNYQSIREHLKPYFIVARRRTTINHAFAAAVAPSDTYAPESVREAMAFLGQNPDALACVYCGADAQTWDHVFATVKNSGFSGYGHRLGNLVPCCKPCNSAKGNKDWRRYLEGLDPLDRSGRGARMEAYLARYAFVDAPPGASEDHQRMVELRDQVLSLLAEADRVAARIRAES